jgi:hypothetical protein
MKWLQLNCKRGGGDGFGYLWEANFNEPFRKALHHEMASIELPYGDVADAHFTIVPTSYFTHPH